MMITIAIFMYAQIGLFESGMLDVTLEIKFVPAYEKNTPVKTVNTNTHKVKIVIFVRDNPAAIPEAMSIAPSGSNPAIPSKNVARIKESIGQL